MFRSQKVRDLAAQLSGAIWQDSRLRLPKEGDLIVVDRTIFGFYKEIKSYYGKTIDSRWVDTPIEQGTYLLILDIKAAAALHDEDRGVFLDALLEDRRVLMRTAFMKWRLVT